ncbi:DUF5615 family PIN-like protein [Rhizorhabdus sp. FW153]|uniref:DUF5615 family PIN-like protein n=1 Tax=Rhizorhabdus sp. FW153 TaxID=3400216 RepID=UPI003CE977E6
MLFLIDHNVQTSVHRVLKQMHHDVALSKIEVGQDAPDPVVATRAMEQGRILVSHDRDMKRIQRFVSPRDRARYPALSRLMLQLPEPLAARRLREMMPLIECEFELARHSGQPMLVHLQERIVRILR